MATVNIPYALQQYTNGTSKVDADGSNLAEVFDAMERQFPGILSRLYNRGELRRFFRVAVNDVVVLEKRWIDLGIRPTDTITIVSAIAGG
jgi:sulfur-carrier protein